ncbi:MAG: hypothetical protein F6K17_05700 [Okeania sp. SIO3C4]|nr:hypothetical protein [Okeania sp. SIO3B3]NER02161.1 hypothetical protein [Okeania sp. SIO3C4]
MQRPYRVLLMTMWFINLKSAVNHNLSVNIRVINTNWLIIIKNAIPPVLIT